MKILAINSSPRSQGQSKTELMLNHLVQGMLDCGAEVDVVHLRNKTIKNCVGCFTCWTKTPGLCVHKDDMSSELFPRWLKSDLLVYATPLYHYTVNAALKNFIERTLPALEPFFEERDGIVYHPWRHQHPDIVMLSVAGFPHGSVFDQLSSYVNFMFQHRLIAEIYRPAAETMTGFAEKKDDILDATVRAGHELVESGKISPGTMSRIEQPIVDLSLFMEIGNLFWKTCITERVSPATFSKKNMVLLPDSLETFMMMMPLGFNSKSAGDTRATLQFIFSGKIEGACYFKIENGTIEAQAGAAEKPDLTIQTPFDVWMDIFAGKADGQQLFMEQKYQVEGDLSLLMKLGQLFGG